MKTTIGFIVCLLLVLASNTRAVERTALAARNLEWCGLTVDKIEKDLGEFCSDRKLTDTNAITEVFQRLHSKITSLKKSLDTATAKTEDIDSALNLAKTVSGGAQLLLDRMGDLEGKQKAYQDLISNNQSLTKTDLGTRHDHAMQLLAESVVHQVGFQLEEKTVEASEAEGEWNLQGLQCDQQVEFGYDEAAYLNRKEELQNAIRDTGKNISMQDFEAAREHLRNSKREQQELAVEKQKLSNQVSTLQAQVQLIDVNAAKLSEATDHAREAYDQAQEAVQHAIDEAQ